MPVVRVHHYSVDETNVEEFLKRRTVVIDAIRADHPALSETRLIKLEDGTYTDTWVWDSHAQMGAAFAAAGSLAAAGAAWALTSDVTGVNGEIVDQH
jgi:hypothetical protein